MSKENKSNTGFRNSRNTAQLHRAWKKEYFEIWVFTNEENML